MSSIKRGTALVSLRTSVEMVRENMEYASTSAEALNIGPINRHFEAAQHHIEMMCQQLYDLETRMKKRTGHEDNETE
jgi:hypothetical protein